MVLVLKVDSKYPKNFLSTHVYLTWPAWYNQSLKPVLTTSYFSVFQVFTLSKLMGNIKPAFGLDIDSMLAEIAFVKTPCEAMKTQDGEIFSEEKNCVNCARS